MLHDYGFVFDIDGTLCPIKKKDERYEDLVPYAAMVEKLRQYRILTGEILALSTRTRRVSSWTGWINGRFPMMKSSMESRGRDIRDSMSTTARYAQMNFCVLLPKR